MRKIRFKKPTINWKKLFNYLFLIFLSSLILLTFLIALPLTEKLTDIVAFDLNVQQNFWAKEYFLDLESENSDDINKSKNTLFKRLNNYGVEEISITETDNLLKVYVKTTKPENYVDELIRNPYQYSIVTRKEDVDFEDEENQLAQYLAENYNSTEFDHKIFRNIYITELPSTSGEDSYFGIAKPWPHKKASFDNFLNEYADQYVGISIDGFVTPVYIPSDANIFAIPLGAQEDTIEVIDLLYNSGNIPTTYVITRENSVDVKSYDINYIEVTVAIFVSILVIYAYMLFVNMYSKEMVMRSLFITLFSLAMFLTFLKISTLPINIFILTIDAIILIILSNILQQNNESRISILIITLFLGFIFKFLGIGYLILLGNHLIILSVILFLSIFIGNLYIDKINTYFKK
jgi:preprotein translocase subunit SecD